MNSVAQAREMPARFRTATRRTQIARQDGFPKTYESEVKAHFGHEAIWVGNTPGSVGYEPIVSIAGVTFMWIRTCEVLVPVVRMNRLRRHPIRTTAQLNKYLDKHSPV